MDIIPEYFVPRWAVVALALVPSTRIAGLVLYGARLELPTIS